MSDDHATVRVRLLYPFAVVLEREGVSRDVLLAAAGLTREVFDDPNARIPYVRAGQFLRAAVERTSHAALGFEAAKQHDAAQFHLLEYYVASSPRVETAIADFLRHQDLLADTRVLTTEPHGDDVVLRYQPPEPRPRAFIEYVLGSLLLGATRSLGGRSAEKHVRSMRIVSVCVACPVPPHAREAYATFFGTNITFDAAYSGLVISSRIMRRKTARANPTAHGVLEAQLRVQRGDRRQTFTERTRELIAGALSRGAVSQDAIARALRVSRTTLKRRLASEGTHLRALVADVRKEVALRAMKQPDLNVNEVARLAGYDDATAFSKAFKRWVGLSPAEHRAQSRTKA